MFKSNSIYLVKITLINFSVGKKNCMIKKKKIFKYLDHRFSSFLCLRSLEITPLLSISILISNCIEDLKKKELKVKTR